MLNRITEAFRFGLSIWQLQQTLLMSPSSSPLNGCSKLAKLRELMKAKNLQAYYIPSEDAHQVSPLAKSH